MQHLPPETPADQVQRIQASLPIIKTATYAITIAVFVVQVVYMLSVILVMNSPKAKSALAAPGTEPNAPL